MRSLSAIGWRSIIYGFFALFVNRLRLAGTSGLKFTFNGEHTPLASSHFDFMVRGQSPCAWDDQRIQPTVAGPVPFLTLDKGVPLLSSHS